jgi:serine/threonine protein kinase/DNA-directed RNA polymerase subunit RPC12/RpoP
MSEAQVKTLGEILIENGLISETDLQRCINIQKTQTRSGLFLRIGEVLVNEGMLSADKISQALQEQQVVILVCSICNAQFNVENFSETEEYKCRRCRGKLEKPSGLSSVDVEDTISGSVSMQIVSGDGKAVNDRVQAGIASFGDYEIIGEISRGGMAIVYKARQPKLKRIVALKILIDRDKALEKDVERFQHEAISISRLRHPGIVAVFDVGTIDGVDFFTMDYVEGTTLDRAVILENLSVREIAGIFVKVCEALEFAHSKKILHRDIKPKNILLDPYNQPVIVDFGIAKNDSEIELIVESELLGSPAYLPPEYISGEQSYDVQCEIYAIGTTLYQLLSGRNPNDDANTKQILLNAAIREVAPLRTIAAQVPLPLHQIVMTCLERNPKDRYLSARHLADDLRRYLDGQEIQANYSAMLLKWRVLRVKVAVFLVMVVSIVLTFSSGYYARLMSTKDLSIEELKNDRDRWKKQYIDERLNYFQRLLAAKKFKQAKTEARVFYRANPEANAGRGLALKKQIFK